MKKRVLNVLPTKYNLSSIHSGYTIVEVIIVIVIIGILATITFVSYNGIQDRAVTASLQSDLQNASDQLMINPEINNNDYFPDQTVYTTKVAGGSIKWSSGTNATFVVNTTNTPKTFCLTATKRNVSYFITQEGLPMPGPCPVLYLDAGIPTSYPGTGTTWTDLSGNGNNGAMYGGVTYSSSNGGFMNFDGTNDYVSIGDSNILDYGTGNFSFSYWIYVPTYISTTNRERGVINKNVSYENSAGWGSEIILYNPSQSNFVINAYNTGQTTWSNTNVSSGNLSTNMWHNIYCKREGGTLYLYDDAVLKGSNNNVNVSINVDNNQPIILGDHSWGSNYPGSLSDIRIYNRALTSTEISQNFNAQKSRYGL